jgi:hypothetical protein
MKPDVNTRPTPILNRGMQLDFPIPLFHILTHVIFLQESHNEIASFRESKLLYMGISASPAGGW